jgi:hypothetical protein
MNSTFPLALNGNGANGFRFEFFGQSGRVVAPFIPDFFEWSFEEALRRDLGSLCDRFCRESRHREIVCGVRYDIGDSDGELGRRIRNALVSVDFRGGFGQHDRQLALGGIAESLAAIAPWRPPPRRVGLFG